MKKEINRYRLALFQYYLSYVLPKDWFKTEYGFCNHFDAYFGRMEKPLPTLYKLGNENGSFWFPKGKLTPRIKMLKEAIRICKDEANR